MSRTTTLRLRRVRFKDGRVIEVLRRKPDPHVSDRFRGSAEKLLASGIGEDMKAFAVVAWDRNGNGYVDFQNSPDSLVPCCAMPQMVKDMILAEQASRWAQD